MWRRPRSGASRGDCLIVASRLGICTRAPSPRRDQRLQPRREGKTIKIRRWNPDRLSQPDGYSQIVTVQGAHKSVYLGGKAGVRADGSIPESLREQTKLIFDNVTLALAEAGASPADVVEIQVFIVDLPNVDPSPVYDAIRRYFPADAKPVSMVIGVDALAYPKLLVEIRLKAVVADDPTNR